VIGERVGLDWLETQLESLPVGTQWQRWAARALEDDLYLVRRHLVEKVIVDSGGSGVDAAVDDFFARRLEAVARLEAFSRSLAVDGVTDLAQFTVALRQIRTLLT
jgi:NAD-specific glutamate dehydrogenase